MCVYAKEDESVTVLKVVPGGWRSMYSVVPSKADVEVVLIHETPPLYFLFYILKKIQI